MTDADLTKAVAQSAATLPNTTAGVDAMFALAATLANEPEFTGPPRMVSSGRGWRSASPDSVAQRMLAIARETGDPSAAVAWLRKVFATKQVTFGAVKALYGVKCSGRITLSDKIVLMPFAELPASQTRAWIIQDHNAANERGGGLHGFTQHPAAALFRVGDTRPLFEVFTPTLQTPSTNAWFDELDEATRLLALTPRAIPIEAAHWLQVDDTDVAMLVNFGVARSFPLDVHPPQYHDPPEITLESMKGLLPAFQKLHQRDKPRFKLALERLMRSRCQQIPGNRAIDLAIALEVLFTGKDQGEHSYKISLRAARLLRDTLDARRTVFTEVQGIYGLRSSMVHTGSGSDTYNVNGVPRTANDLVESVDVHCADALRQILLRGAIPESWRDIELG